MTDLTFEGLYRGHAGDVYRYTLAVLHNPADAEDAMQTTFLNAYRSVRSGRRPEKVSNWLIAIAHNVCRERFRRQARRPEEVPLLGEVAAPEVEEIVTADEIRSALGQLSFNQRSALVLRELEGRSYAEIAEILELSVSAVETLLFRARRALREQLEGALSCEEAAAALSRPPDAALRAHLRTCGECARLARRHRAKRVRANTLLAAAHPPDIGI